MKACEDQPRNVKKLMRIALVIDKYYGKTGVATHARDLADNLAKHNVEVSVFASDVQACKSEANLRFIRVADWPGIPQPLTVFFQLILEHGRNAFDVVHVHDSIAFLGVYPFSKLRNVPTVFTVQASIFSLGRKRDYPAYAVSILRFTNRFVAKRASLLLCISEEMIHCMTYAGACVDRIAYQPNPIKPSFFKRSVAGWQTEHDKICLYVGQLRPTKGAESLIRAIPKIVGQNPDTRFVFAGDGPLKEQLITLCATLGVSDRVQFLGHIPYDEIDDVYRQAFLFVFPSLNEPMGLAAVEALASGVPVVASNVGGIPEWVKDGENGFLVEPGSSEELGTAISCLLSNVSLRDKMAQNAVGTVRELSWDKAIDRFVLLYSGLCQPK